MTRPRVRRLGFTAGVIVTMTVSLIAASCSSPPGVPAPSGSSFKFRASSVKVVNHNDTFLYGNRDEVFVYNLWFRVKVGKANSASVGITGSRDNAFDDLGDGQSLVYTGAQRAEVTFNNVQLLDLLDLANPSNGLEVVGSWTWAMDKDDVSVLGVAEDSLDVLENALNTFVAAGTVPSTPEALVSQLLGDFGDAFSFIAGAAFASIPGIPDDPIGSRFYVGIAAKGALSAALDPLLAGVSFPSVAIPVLSVPPDINGGRLFSLGHNNEFTGEVMDQGNGRHDYGIQMLNTATINQPPTANFTATPTSGNPPLAVALDASGSTDDGTIVAYNWNFGDFTTGSGKTANHTFTTAGTFPVTLTVTDDKGESTSKTTNIAVGGAPTVAPTGLTKVGSGCCDTYGDFAWNMVPGATAYEVSMDAFFLGGCLTDHSDVINGQVSSGRVQAFGLCLGSKYNVSIRAQANGQWGPWSPSINITL